MVSLIDDTKTSLELIKKCIEKKESFVLEAGAGSGKTWTLVESLKYILDEYGTELKKYNQKIACITYTNIAKNEIIDRTYNSSILQVATIHEFLWSCVKNYQKELKTIICELNNKSRKVIEELDEKIKNKVITYENYKKLEEGIITHDDIIKISREMFSRFPKLLKIVTDMYPYIFIDEYQDTQKETIYILVNCLQSYRKDGQFMLGFFGDAMQKIYNTGIGKIDSYIPDGMQLKKINKYENYRCSKSVINVLNKIRQDFEQVPTGKNVEGKVTLLYTDSIKKIDEIVISDVIKRLGWNESENKTTKILFLTHKKISEEVGFSNLFDIYNNRYGSFKDEMLYGKKEIFIQLIIDHIELVVTLYKNNNYADFLKVSSYPFLKNSQKKKLKQLMQQLIHLRETKSIKDVIDFAVLNKLIDKSEKIELFESTINDAEERIQAFYKSLMCLEYKEVIRFRDFIDENTVYSTKHGIKGAEFDNVLVVIDDSSWNQYSFNDVFSENTKSTKYERTLNLLYVCCSRSKDNLALLFLSELGENGIESAKIWFGDENVILI